ncbi:chymotrypsin-like elastase family member 2A [Anopheles funestus]|uniref:chymotrypsin-like elastase family member 2A n=1 Tax=Anopheles funestus TaxID=62324 RepID=UPI0020C5F16C|nr:chymotrypsin-like elastase family member 2A [Anopheles funestus]
MVSVYLFPVIVAGIVSGGFEVGAVQLGCGKPDVPCIPIRYCLPVYKRYKNGEYTTNITFKKEVNSNRCEPVMRMVASTHICCPNRDIGCGTNEKPGVCVTREQSTTKQSNNENDLCYVHNGKKYFCCTDTLCMLLKEPTNEEVATDQRSSAFQSCTSDYGAAGFLVPARICSNPAPPAGGNTQDRAVCCVPPKKDYLIANPKAAKLAVSSCGMVPLRTKIQGGNFAQRGELPWMVKLVYKDKPATSSGTLIHTKYVLTAKHCITAQLQSVELGVHDVYDKSEVQTISISRPFVHKIYDVGLLVLAKPATLGTYVQVICLPIYASLRMNLPTTVIISGWGNTESNKVSPVLIKADTKVVMSEKGCNTTYICVGGLPNPNHCPGDSGGPHQAVSKFGELTVGRYVQYGIIADGPYYCSKPDRVSRGVSVGYVIDWILAKMQI